MNISLNEDMNKHERFDENDLRRNLRKIFLDISRSNPNDHFQQNQFLTTDMFNLKKSHLDIIINFLIHWSKCSLNNRILATSVYITYARSVFCHSRATATEKDVARAASEYFSDHGDLHTFLKVFDKWLALPVDERKIFCEKNCLDYYYLAYIDFYVSQLKNLFCDCLLNDDDLPLKSLITFLHEHLVVYSKYDRIGYMNSSKNYLRMHPESVFKTNYLSPPDYALAILDYHSTDRIFVIKLDLEDSTYLRDLDLAVKKENIERYAFGPFSQSFLLELKLNSFQNIQRELKYEFQDISGEAEKRQLSSFIICDVENEYFVVYSTVILNTETISEKINAVVQIWTEEEIFTDSKLINYPHKKAPLEVCVKPGFEIEPSLGKNYKSFFIYIDKTILQLSRKTQSIDIKKELIQKLNNSFAFSVDDFRVCRYRNSTQFPYLWGKLILQTVNSYEFLDLNQSNTWYGLSKVLLNSEERAIGPCVDLELKARNDTQTAFLICFEGEEKDWSAGLLVHRVFGSIQNVSERVVYLELSNSLDSNSFIYPSEDDIKKEFSFQYHVEVVWVKSVQQQEPISISQICSMADSLQDMFNHFYKDSFFQIYEMNSSESLLRARLFFKNPQEIISLISTEHSFPLNHRVRIKASSYKLSVSYDPYVYFQLNSLEYDCLKSNIYFFTELFEFKVLKKTNQQTQNVELKFIIDRPLDIFVLSHFINYLQQLREILNEGKNTFNSKCRIQSDHTYQKIPEEKLKLLTTQMFDRLLVHDDAFLVHNNILLEKSSHYLSLYNSDINLQLNDLCDLECSKQFLSTVVKKLYIRSTFEETSNLPSNTCGNEATLLFKVVGRIRHNCSFEIDYDSLYIPAENYIMDDLAKSSKQCELPILNSAFKQTITETNEERNIQIHARSLNALFNKFGFRKLSGDVCGIEYTLKGCHLKNIATQTEIQTYFGVDLFVDEESDTERIISLNDKCIQTTKISESMNYTNSSQSILWQAFKKHEMDIGLLSEFLVTYAFDIAPPMTYMKNLHIAFAKARENLNDVIYNKRAELGNIKIIKNHRQLLLMSIDMQALSNAAFIIGNFLTNTRHCCICFETEVCDNTMELTLCGHFYCVSCLKNQLSASKSMTFEYPLLCAEDKCYKPILMQDIKKVISTEDVASFIQLSMNRFIAMNKNLIRVCPTSDCEYVFATTTVRNMFKCPGCKTKTCTNCNRTWHEGIPCDFFSSSKEIDPKLTEWMKRNPKNRKLCPNCLIGIEKLEGCNHVICSLCKQEMCWECLNKLEECICQEDDSDNNNSDSDDQSLNSVSDMEATASSITYNFDIMTDEETENSPNLMEDMLPEAINLRQTNQEISTTLYVLNSNTPTNLLDSTEDKHFENKYAVNLNTSENIGENYWTDVFEIINEQTGDN
ncbi:DgyrCDS8042 [Dimorphilus gyrociliatus]|uniref:DgyrCDS8042 n=1 Tax=Dimorphilus gyrociliatus TaxID=2664684 RepID=A0A7I8VUP4_9ANNE|nr:DgyrCDS8042 [Dimorphilus gyrociliatus]